MAMQFWEQNNFRDGIMTDGMTGRNETELYQRSVQDMVDCMPTPFGSVKNQTIGIESRLTNFEFEASNETAGDWRYGELFYGVLTNHSTYGKCTVVFLPGTLNTLFSIIKNGVRVHATWTNYVVEKIFFQLKSNFFIRPTGGLYNYMVMVDEWGNILTGNEIDIFFTNLPQLDFKAFNTMVGSRTVQFYREAGSSSFLIKITPGDYYLASGILEANGGKGSLWYGSVNPTEAIYTFNVVDGLFPSDTSTVNPSTGAIVTNWITLNSAYMYFEPYMNPYTLRSATEAVFWNSRLVLAGMPGYEQRLYISKTAQYGDFSNYSNREDEAIVADIGFTSKINHIISYDQLLVFTERNMYFTSFTTSATPTGFQMRIGTDVSAHDDVRPSILNENLAFVNLTKDKVVLLNPNYNTYNYDYINITLQLYGKLGEIEFITKSSLNTDFLNNHLIIESESGKFLLQIDRNENIISYTRIDNNLGKIKAKIIDENNKEWYLMESSKDNTQTVGFASIEVVTSPKMTIKLHQQRIWFDGRTKHYYDKNMKSKALKIYYRGNLRFYYRGQEMFSEDFTEEARDPEAPKLFQTTQVLWNYDEYVTIENRSGEPFELHSVVVGVV